MVLGCRSQPFKTPCTCMWYGWPLKHPQDQCVCGSNFTMDHATSFPAGGFFSLRNKKIRDILGTLMSCASTVTTIELTLQALTGERFGRRATTTMTTLDQTFTHEVFGVEVAKTHFLICNGCQLQRYFVSPSQTIILLSWKGRREISLVW